MAEFCYRRASGPDSPVASIAPAPYARRSRPPDANTKGSERPPGMDDYVFAGLVTIAVSLLAMGVMDILAVVITTVSNML
jgi:hypothetical protein